MHDAVWQSQEDTEALLLVICDGREVRGAELLDESKTYHVCVRHQALLPRLATITLFIKIGCAKAVAVQAPIDATIAELKEAIVNTCRDSFPPNTQPLSLIYRGRKLHESHLLGDAIMGLGISATVTSDKQQQLVFVTTITTPSSSSSSSNNNSCSSSCSNSSSSSSSSSNNNKESSTIYNHGNAASCNTSLPFHTDRRRLQKLPKKEKKPRASTSSSNFDRHVARSMLLSLSILQAASSPCASPMSSPCKSVSKA